MGTDDAGNLGDRLLAWYARAGRPLPWRQTRDPYAIWVCEVMLQQTRVETVIPYYHRFLERFGSVEALAGAASEEVLGIWEGLGYYGRALRLHEGARAVVASGQGLPDTLAGWRALAGVGPYMAAAIASFTGTAAAPAVDGNVARVLSRVLALPYPKRARASRAIEGTVGEMMAGREDPGRVNQALMDLGATVCLPRDPRCDQCPLAAACLARAGGDPGQFPTRTRRSVVAVLAVRIQVVGHAGRVLVYRRPLGGLLGGLYAFPARFDHEGGPLMRIRGVRWYPQQHAFRHAFTHQVWEVTARVGTVARPGPVQGDMQWVDASDVDPLPMGRVDRKVWTWARELVASGVRV